MEPNKAVKKAMALRLKTLLDAFEKAQSSDYNAVRYRWMTETQIKAYERQLAKQVNALKIVIWMLMPMTDKGGHMPSIYNRKNNKVEKVDRLPKLNQKVQGENTPDVLTTKKKKQTLF
jgi:hypothetical protein